MYSKGIRTYRYSGFFESTTTSKVTRGAVSLSQGDLPLPTTGEPPCSSRLTPWGFQVVGPYWSITLSLLCPCCRLVCQLHKLRHVCWLGKLYRSTRNWCITMRNHALKPILQQVLKTKWRWEARFRTSVLWVRTVHSHVFQPAASSQVR